MPGSKTLRGRGECCSMGRGGGARPARTASKGQGVPTWFTAVPLLFRVGGAFRGLDYVALGPQRHSERQRAPARMLLQAQFTTLPRRLALLACVPSACHRRRPRRPPGVSRSPSPPARMSKAPARRCQRRRRIARAVCVCRRGAPHQAETALLGESKDRTPAADVIPGWRSVRPHPQECQSALAHSHIPRRT